MKILNKFIERYDKLNDEQRLAVDVIEGPVLVVAGPGSGKTELLSLRTANILKQTDVLPSSILCLTFTDAAAINMRKRLASIIGDEAYKVAIHTFHSFGTEIINQNPQYFYNGAIYTPADDLMRYEILEGIFENLKHDSCFKSYHPEQGYTYLRDVISRISELKKAGLNPDEFKKIVLSNKEFLDESNPLIAEIFQDRVAKGMIQKIRILVEKLQRISLLDNQIQKNYRSLKETVISSLVEACNLAEKEGSTSYITIWKTKYTKKNAKKETVLKDLIDADKHIELAEVYEKYQETLHQKGYFDYEDMILDASRAIEENIELKYNLQERYLYVLVDEFQDTSGVQMRLLDNLLDASVNEGRPNILAVGDDDQSIFKFQGANIENILQFHEKYNDPQLVVLWKNYRSNQNILDLVRKVVLTGEDRLEKRLPDQIKKELFASNLNVRAGQIKEKEFETQLHELKWLAEEIKAKVGQGIDVSEIAVIAPMHKILEEAARVLDYFGIPVFYERKNDILSQKHVTEILTILEFVNSLNKKNQSEADEFLPEILSFGFFELDRLDIWKISVQANREKRLWLEIMLDYDNKFIRDLAKFFIYLGAEVNERTAEEIIDIITGVHSIAIDEDSQFTSPYKQYYFSDVTKYQYLDFLQTLQAFIDAIREYAKGVALKVADVLEFVNLHKVHKLPLITKSQFESGKKSVSLLTVHGAKGLEFDTVFVLDCMDEVWVKKRNFSKINFPANLPLSPQADNLDDSLRRFYVALSRAKSDLYLSNYRFNFNGKEQVKLRFLTDYEDEVKEKNKGRTLGEIQAMQDKIKNDPSIKELVDLKYQIANYKPINVDEKTLIQGRLDDYKLSVTHLNNFLNVADAGPQTFLEKNLLRFPEMQNKSGVYGSAVHLALQHLQKEFKASKILPEKAKFLNLFEKALTSKRLNEKDTNELIAKGRDNLGFYYDHRKNSFDYNDQAEFNFVHQGVVIGEAQITGKIDKMKINQESREISVFDYKTGKALFSWNGSGEYEKIKLWKYRNQLVFYKLLTENAQYFKGMYKVNSGVLEFVEPMNNEIITLNLDISFEETEKMKNLIKVVYAKIMNLDFPDVSHYDKSLYGIQCFIDDLLK
ncbi:ATP-dependent helicase [Patescibacteria group bacterium]|nr:ATP-dependent helicase [Patescibacteria group bacterium]